MDSVLRTEKTSTLALSMRLTMGGAIDKVKPSSVMQSSPQTASPTFSTAVRSLKDAFLLLRMSILFLAWNSTQKWSYRASSKSRPPRFLSQAWERICMPDFFRLTMETCTEERRGEDGAGRRQVLKTSGE